MVKKLVKLNHELLSGYLVYSENSECEAIFEHQENLLSVFSSKTAVEEYFQLKSSEYEISDTIINDCLQELSKSHHVIDHEVRDHLLEVYNLLDDISSVITIQIDFREKEEALDLLNGYVQIAMDRNRYKIISRLVENINIIIMDISKDYYLIEED